MKASSDLRKGPGPHCNIWTQAPFFDYEGRGVPEKSAEAGQGALFLSDYSVGVVNTAGASFIVDAMDPEHSGVRPLHEHSPSTSHKCTHAGAWSGGKRRARRAVIREWPASEKAAGREGPDMQALVTELLENPEAIPPPRLHLFTTRAVMAGEELLFDYGDLYWESMKARGRGEALV